VKTINARASVSELKIRQIISTTEKTFPAQKVDVLEVKINGEWSDGDNKFPISIHLTIPPKSDRFLIGDELNITLCDDVEEYLRTIHTT
jgi:hypothetical protein